MPSNPARLRTRASLGGPNHRLEVQVDCTFQRRKSEGEVHKVVVEVDSHEISIEVKDRSPNNSTPASTPPSHRESFSDDESSYETAYDSDVSTHLDTEVRPHRRPPAPIPSRAFQYDRPALSMKDRSFSPSPSSHLPSPPASPSPTTCAGITKLGNCCRRTKKGQPQGWLCHSHNNSVNSLPPLERDEGIIMRFDDFISRCLHPVTQEKMQNVLKNPPTKSDGPGYVYAFAYKADDSDAPESGELDPYVIKIGRTESDETLQQRRHDFVGCSHPRQVEEIGWWPGNVVDGDAAGSFGAAILQHRLGKQGNYSYKVERLVHLELRDVACNSLHLMPGFAQGGAGLSEGSKSGSLGAQWPSRIPELSKERCLNCPRIHRETFRLKRVAGHDMVGREWEDVVRPIIEKWGRFMDEYGDMLHLISWI